MPGVSQTRCSVGNERHEADNRIGFDATVAIIVLLPSGANILLPLDDRERFLLHQAAQRPFKLCD
jgi:hypothetical protein